MYRTPPVGSANFADWKDGDRAAGTKGSRVPHRAFTDLIEEIAFALEQFGFTLDPDDLTQVHQLFKLLGQPGPNDPPIAPNLPRMVYYVDGSQGFPDAVATNVSFATEEENNFIDSTFDGVLWTCGPSDGGLLLIMSCMDFVGGAGARGINVHIMKTGVAQGVAKDNRTSGTSANLGACVAFCGTVSPGESYYIRVSRDDAGGGSGFPTAFTSRFSVTKLSVA